MAGYKVFQVLNRKPEIRNDAKGKTITDLKGEFEFKNVKFNYPSKPDI